MAALNPPDYIQASSHGADAFRRALKALRAQAGVVSSGDLAVAQNGTPNMSVNVAAGQAIIDGTENAVTQGSYVVTNDAVVNLAVAASDPTNPRNDLVVAKVQDAFYSGATSAWSLAVITGTPAGSPVDPATPANSITLARIRVDALAATIVNAKITDLRADSDGAIFPGSAGWTLWDSTGALKNIAVTDVGLMTLRNGLEVPPAAGATLPTHGYGTVTIEVDSQTVSGVASVAIPAAGNLPTGFKHLRLIIKLRGSVAAASTTLAMRFNGDAGNNYGWQLMNATGTGAPTATQGPDAIAQIVVGTIAGNTAPANRFGVIIVDIFDYNSATDHKHVLTRAFWQAATGSGGMAASMGGGIWVSTAPITSIALIATSGNVSGSVGTEGVTG